MKYSATSGVAGASRVQGAHIRPRVSARSNTQEESSDVAWDIRLMRVMAAVFFTITFVLLSVLAVQWLANRGVFAIERLLITGDLQHVNAASVRAQATSKLNGSFFTLDLLKAKSELEQLPWVRHAVVKRVWPHGIAVAFEAHQPVAFWTTVPDAAAHAAAADERLLNNYAEVFEANVDEIEEDLPHLQGPVSHAPRVWAMYRELNEKFQAAAQSSKVAALTLTARGEWEVELDDGLALNLGRDDEKLWERVATYLGTVEQARAQLNSLGQHASWARIDLRHNQGYAVALRNKAAQPVAENAATVKTN